MQLHSGSSIKIKDNKEIKFNNINNNKINNSKTRVAGKIIINK